MILLTGQAEYRKKLIVVRGKNEASKRRNQCYKRKNEIF